MGIAPSACELQAALKADFQGQLTYKFCLPGTSYAVGSHAVCEPNANSAALLGLPHEPLVLQLVNNGGHLLPGGLQGCGGAAGRAGAQAAGGGCPAALANFLAELDPVCRQFAQKLPAPRSATHWLRMLTQWEACSDNTCKQCIGPALSQEQGEGQYVDTAALGGGTATLGKSVDAPARQPSRDRAPEPGLNAVARALRALAALSPATPVRQLAAPHPGSLGEVSAAPQQQPSPESSDEAAQAAPSAGSSLGAGAGASGHGGGGAPGSAGPEADPSPLLAAHPAQTLEGERPAPCLPAAPVLAAFLAPGGARLWLVARRAPYTLGALLRFSPGALGSDGARRLLLWQVPRSRPCPCRGLRAPWGPVICQHCCAVRLWHCAATMGAACCWAGACATHRVTCEVAQPCWHRQT